MTRRITLGLRVGIALLLSRSAAGAQDSLHAAANSATLTIDWQHPAGTSHTEASYQIVVNPPLLRGSAIHDAAWQSVRDMRAPLVRYVPWLPYPRLGVAELAPPTRSSTSWDFRLLDPHTIDFLEATKGQSVMLNFSTVPQWMWTTARPVTYPDRPDSVTWSYTQGSEPRDSSMREIAGYFARVLGWYTRGGFTDENGRRHESGHHYDISHWEVLNEPDLEHHLSPAMYTRLYDAVVRAMREVSPRTKFGGISLAFPGNQPDFFTYFLDPKHHAPGVPVDFITYHFYANAGSIPAAQWPALYFTQADQFLEQARWIEAIRKQLSPGTRTYVNEVGSIALGMNDEALLPDFYWNLSGATYAYLFSELSRTGVDAVHESQLVGYPSQFPSVSMLDWNTGRGNARYWVLKLLRDSFAPGDRFAPVTSSVPRANVAGYTTSIGEHPPYASAVIGRDGRRRVLLVNRRNESARIMLTGAKGGAMACVDRSTGQNPAASRRLESDEIVLAPFAVAVVTLR